MTIRDIETTLEQAVLIESCAPTAGNSTICLTAQVDDWPELRRVLEARQVITFRVAAVEEQPGLLTRWLWFLFKQSKPMTVASICTTIDDAVIYEATKDGGPDVDDRVVHVQGPVEAGYLKRVLDAKGCLIIKLRMLPTIKDGYYMEAGAAQMAALKAQAEQCVQPQGMPTSIMVDGQRVDL